MVEAIESTATMAFQRFSGFVAACGRVGRFCAGLREMMHPPVDGKGPVDAVWPHAFVPLTGP